MSGPTSRGARAVSRVGLLMCGHVDQRAEAVAGDYPDLFGALLADESIELVRYDLDAGRFPDSERDCDGWLCSPARDSAYDPVGWIADAEELHRRIVAAEVPYVGICFGHQLLAQALGGRVERAPGGWNVGVHEYVIDRQLPFMDPRVETIRLLASHQDQVVAVPQGATVFARAPDGSCAVGGMAIGDRAWTLQLHPEFVPELAARLLDLRVDVIGTAKVDVARASLAAPLSRAVVARWIGRFFAGA